MDYRITADERARFKRCRRQWDFASPHRRNLQPAGSVEDALPSALRDALAAYYYPGTWDWQPDVTQPLVHRALERSLEQAGAADVGARGVRMLDCYDAWASSLDDFAPVKVNTDVTAMVPDPDEPERGLTVHDGSPVLYQCRLDLVAVDAADDYWVVRHQIVDAWQPLETLLRDEEAVAACWAFEHDYLGLELAGTIHNEVRIDGPLTFPTTDRTVARMNRTVAQHEPSGGGRSLPQHRRGSASTSPPGAVNRTEQRTAGLLRRTRIRRSRHEIATVGVLIAAEALDMTRWPASYPTPGAHCRECEFLQPCLAITDGIDPDSALTDDFRPPHAAQPKPRLGQSTWGFGRGGAPPQW